MPEMYIKKCQKVKSIEFEGFYLAFYLENDFACKARVKFFSEKGEITDKAKQLMQAGIIIIETVKSGLSYKATNLNMINLYAFVDWPEDISSRGMDGTSHKVELKHLVGLSNEKAWEMLAEIVLAKNAQKDKRKFPFVIK